MIDLDDCIRVRCIRLREDEAESLSYGENATECIERREDVETWHSLRFIAVRNVEMGYNVI